MVKSIDEYMQLLNRFLKKRESQKNFFLSLLIKPDKIGAILFEEINSKLFILSTNEVDVDDTSVLSGEELLSISDKAISFVESKLPEGSDVEKTIFSVPYYWVEGGLPAGRQGKIRQEYLEKLKKVCKDLGLVPVGYIVSIEATVAFLQKSEGAPVSGIFIELTKNKLLLYIVRAGKIIEEKQADIEGNIIKTCEKLLQEVESVDVLPSKIVILDHKNASHIQQEFISHQWSKDIPFLHLPQVMMLEKGFENEAIINGVATQMELEVLHDVTAPKEEEEDLVLEHADTQDFGFVKEDAKSKPEKKNDGENDKEQSDTGTKTTEEVERGPQLRSQLGKKDKEEEPNISYFKEDNLEADANEGKPKLPPLKIEIPNASAVVALFQNLKFPKLNRFPFSQNLSGPLKYKLILGLIGVIILAFFVSFIYYSFVLKAEIKIMSDKKNIDVSQNVLFSQDPTDGTNISIEISEETITGSENKNSTGKKETGDAARGEVTLYNKTEQKKTFPKGTVVIGPNDLEFELTEEVNIASTSPFSTSLTNAKGKITAANFGKEYNLASNTNFTIKGFSSFQFIGKNSDSITGGTKTETTVVSSEDLDELLAEAIEKLEKEAISKAREKVSAGEAVLSSALSSEVVERKYTKKENEEADSVGISAKIKYSVGKYLKSDLDSVMESLSNAEIPATYKLRKEDSKVEITNVKIDKDQKATASVKVNAVYAPQIENEKLAESLRGKTPSAAENQIKRIRGVTDVVITFRNRVPFMPLVLPRQGRNILIGEEY